MDKTESKLCAIDTVEKTKSGRYEVDGKIVNISRDVQVMLERSKLYRDEDIFVTRAKEQVEPKYFFTGKTTTNAIASISSIYKDKHYKVGALNFASAKHPGGGFLKGAQAQEESIAKVSTLYESLIHCPEYYANNYANKSSLYTDYIIYSENVTIFKDDNGDYLTTPINVDIITSPAPNAAAIRKNEPHNESRIYSVLENRIRKIIKIAANNNIDCLVLGAFGCGVFGNNLKDVAEIFSKILIDEEYEYYFKLIEFAIYDRDPRTCNLFKQYFEA